MSLQYQPAGKDVGSGHCVFVVQRKACNMIRVKDMSFFSLFTIRLFRWLVSLHACPSLVSVSLEALYRELYSGLQVLLDG